MNARPAAGTGGTYGSDERAARVRAWLLGLALLLATFVAYLPAVRAGYVWDDDWYLSENALLRDAGGLARIWIPGNTPQYYPAVFTSFWLEWRLFGADPGGYHLVNVALHALGALLVWRLFRALEVPGAWLVGAVFALHPVHVESVAWITERKNVLSGVFYLSAALAYLRFLGSAGERALPRVSRWRWYAAALLLFAGALLSKTVTCSLPAALILVLLWRRERLHLGRLAPLAPFFALGLALALHTAWLERTHVGAEGPDYAFGFAERAQIAGRALFFYPQKLLFPWPLVFVYPRWELDASDPGAYAPVVLVAAVAVLALAAYVRGTRGPALALAFFAATLFPALGFFNFYPMRYSFVADHFQYLASLGVIALVVGAAARSVSNRALAGAAALAVLSVLAVMTWRQARVYESEETLWRATLRHNPGAWMAHSNLAKVLSERGMNEDALEHLERALALNPGSRAADRIRSNLAVTLSKLDRHGEALENYLRVQASSGGMELELARTLERLGRDEDAERFYREALDEGDPEALVPFGVHLLRRGRPDEAIPWLERFIDLHPDAADAMMFLADAYAAAGRLDDAIRTGERALELARARGESRMSDVIRRRLGPYRGDRV